MPPTNLFCGLPARAEVHAEIIRLSEQGVAHVFAFAPVTTCGDRPAVGAAVVEMSRLDSVREE